SGVDFSRCAIGDRSRRTVRHAMHGARLLRHWTALHYTLIAMTRPRLRPANRADLPRVHAIRHGTTENRLSDPSLVTEAEVLWYLDNALFLVSEDEAGVRGVSSGTHQPAF